MVSAKMKFVGMSAATALLGIFAAGCGDSVPKGRPFGPWEPTMQNPPVRTIKPSGTEKSIDMLKPDDVVVAVNGVALTRREIDTRLAQIRANIARNATLSPRDRAATYKMFGSRLISNWIDTQIAVWESRKLGCATEEEIRTAVSKGIERISDSRKTSIGTLDKKIPGGLDFVRYDIEEATWVAAYITNNVNLAVEVDSNMVARIMASIEAENAEIAATNAVKLAHMEKIREMAIKPGADFGKLADEFSEDTQLVKDGTGYWGEFTAEEISDRKLREKFFRYGVGEISEIIDDNDGYMIIKVLEKDPVAYDPENDKARITMARIYVEHEQLTTLADPEGMQKDIERQYRERAVKAQMEKLRAAAEIVYPYGKDVWGASAKREELKKRNESVKKEREKYLAELAKRKGQTNGVEKTSSKEMPK